MAKRKGSPTQDDVDDAPSATDARDQRVPVAKRPKPISARKPVFVKPESDEDSEPLVHKPKSAKSKAKKIVKDEEDSDELSEPLQAAKSKAPKKVYEARSTSTDVVRTDADGQHYVDLGKRKRATVSDFKGSLYLNIREYYAAADGEEKPGKKGIMLTREQWDTIRNHAEDIDRFFSAQGGKK